MKKVELTTTLALLHKARACTNRYKHLAKSLGGVNKYGRNKPINLLTVLEHNGVDDMLWCLRAVPTKQEATRDKAARLMAADFAEQVLPIFKKHHPKDKRPELAIKAARDYAHGRISDKELAAARDAARDAAWAAAWAAAWDAAWDAARAAARDAARDAAWAAAQDAAWDVARATAWAAARKVQAKIIKQYLSE